MKLKNPLTVIVVVAAVSAIGGMWTLVHGQARATSSSADGVAAPAPKPGAANSNKNPYGNFYRAGQHANELILTSPAGEDPEMAKLIEGEGEWSQQVDEILARYAESEDATEQKKIRAELREALAKQFDVQKQRRELELARIEERIKKLRDQIKKRNDARDTIIDRRLDQLVNEAEGLGWAPGSGSGLQNGHRALFSPGRSDYIIPSLHKR